jgi:hypothetical protein
MAGAGPLVVFFGVVSEGGEGSFSGVLVPPGIGVIPGCIVVPGAIIVLPQQPQPELII